MSTPALSLRSVTKYYKNLRALDDVSLEVAEGDFFGFLGPNGAGKTTTINILTGLGNFSRGEVSVFGHDVVREYRVTRGLIGLAPQEFNFDPFLSIEGILTFQAGYFGVPARRARERARSLLEQFGLAEKRKVGFRRLSGGLKRRLLLARALVHEPRVLILDEPTAGVDLELRYKLWELLRDLNRKGTTVFLTTHYIEEAERLCSRVAVIDRGKILACGTKDELLRTMKSDWVEISLSGPLASVPSELAGRTAELLNGGTRLRFLDEPGVLDSALRAVQGRGLAVLHVEVDRTSLEDVFVRLTRMREAVK